MNEAEIQELQAHLRALQKQFRRDLPPVDGLSHSAVRVLGAVVRGGGAGVQPGQLAGELGMTTSNVAAALRALEGSGYVTRQRDDGDRRRIAVRLTKAGTDAVAEHRMLRVGGLRAAIDAELNADEQAQLRAAIPLLGRLAAHGTGEGR